MRLKLSYMKLLLSYMGLKCTCLCGTQKGAYLKLKGTFYETESNLGIWNSNCLHRNEIELYRTRIYLYWIIMHLIGTETFLYVTKTKLF